MNSHKNASLTPRGREYLVRNIVSQGTRKAADAAGVSTRTAVRWKRRHQIEGVAGLRDRSSRPHRSPTRIGADKAERIVGLRRNQRLGYAQIAERVGVSKSTVGRVCLQAGLAKLPSVQHGVPVRRYEKERPGELLHLDMKKLGCFDQPGHRVTGDRTRNTPRAGWQALHVAIDDRSRVGFSQVLSDETSRSACDFLIAALRYYRQLGVPIQAVMTDNGAAYKCRRFAKLLRRLGIKHKRTRPYTPLPTARQNASSRPSCANGPTLTATPAQTCELLNCSPGCNTTTSAGRIPLFRTNLPPPDSASTGTTS